MNLRELLGERPLFVHAHPDDETLETGALIAACANQGIEPHLVTCTRGEQGEGVTGVIPSDFTMRELTDYREKELEAAVGVLGVVGQYWLGTAPARAAGREDRRYHDSGMVWIGERLAGPAEVDDETTFTAASIEEAAADLVHLITTINPSSIVSYDESGTYGHPDHVRAHEIAAFAAMQTGVPFLETAGDVSDESFTRLELGEYLDVVIDALSRFRSQLTVYPDHIEHVGGQRAEFTTTVDIRRSARSRLDSPAHGG